MGQCAVFISPHEFVWSVLTWGVMVRKNATAHKRLLFLATLILIEAGFNRLYSTQALTPPYGGCLYRNSKSVIIRTANPSALLFYNDLLLILLFIYDFVTVRHIHKITLIAGGCIIGAHFTITMLWRLLT